MASRFQNFRPGVLVLALAISVFIWAVAQGTSSVIQSFDVEVELVGVEDGLVITDQSSDEINVRLRGSRAALRNLDTGQLKYRVDARGASPASPSTRSTSRRSIIRREPSSWVIPHPDFRCASRNEGARQSGFVPK